MVVDLVAVDDVAVGVRAAEDHKDSLQELEDEEEKK